MKVLNLVHPDRGDVKYNVTSFSDSQILLNLEGPYSKGNTNIEASVTIKSRMSWEDIQLIICAHAALKEAGFKYIHLYIPYFLGARSDRKFLSGSVNYLKSVICPLINSLNFASVTVLDPHSNCLEMGLNNYKQLDNSSLIEFAIKKQFDIKSLSICYPDEGAQKRYSSLNKTLGISYFNCSKVRDVKTGDIIKTEVNGVPNNHNDDILIIDDICDGGRTFIEIAKVLKVKAPSSKLYLCVTHGIFSNGFLELKKYFDGIFCTNSVCEIDVESLYSNTHLKVSQLNVF